MNGSSMTSCYIRIFPQDFPNHLFLISITHYSMHPNREQQHDVGADARKDPVAPITVFLYSSRSTNPTTRMLDNSANTAIVYATLRRWPGNVKFLLYTLQLRSLYRLLSHPVKIYSAGDTLSLPAFFIFGGMSWHHFVSGTLVLA